MKFPNFTFIDRVSNGATFSRSSTSCNSFVASRGVNVVTFPVNRNRPPRRFISPALMVIRFSPIPEITCITSASDPFPIATIMMTAAIPIMMPKEAKNVRVLLVLSEAQTIARAGLNFTFFLRRQEPVSSKDLFRGEHGGFSCRLNSKHQTDEG